MKDDCTSSCWVQLFLYKSSTTDLRKRLDFQYKNLPASLKGGVAYLYLQLQIMVHMSRDTVTALKKYIELSKDNGLRRMQGKNAVIAEQELTSVCTRLNKVNALPDKTIVDVLDGLTNFLVPEFTKLFGFLLQSAIVNSLDLDEAKNSDTLAQVRKIY